MNFKQGNDEFKKFDDFLTALQEEYHKVVSFLVEVSGDEKLQKAYSEIQKITLSRKHITDIQILKRLGLCGEQLELKRTFLKELSQDIDEPAFKEVRKKMNEKFSVRKIVEKLKMLLRLLNSLLSSLSICIPEADALKELKDIAEIKFEYKLQM